MNDEVRVIGGSSFIDESALALKMLEYEQKAKELNKLEKVIKLLVETLGKTVVAGRVRATYSQGRKKYDYETGAREHAWFNDEVVSTFTKVHPDTVDWRSVYNHLVDEHGDKQDGIPFTQGDPSVSIKIKKE
jgi:protease II